MKKKLLTKFLLLGLSAFTAFPVKAKLPELSKDENPLVLMFAINGAPKNEHFGKLLKGFKDAGITQFLIYPRSGCEFNYMKDDWLGAIKYIVDEAKRLDFSSVWLYDEFNWPSGTANKQVMKINSDFALKHLSAVKNKDGSIGFEIVSNMQMPNLLNPKTTDCFISLTHEKYYELLKDDFGKIIKGIFTDEPSIGYFVKDDRYIKSIPYYDGIEEEYHKATGSDLRADIITGIRTNSEPYQESLSKILAKRFRESYFDRISNWCEEHNILATGHMLNESSSKISIESSGHILDTLSGLTFPALDEVYTRSQLNRFEWLTFGSAAYATEQNDSRGGMAELFALGPCDMSLAKIRRQIWLASSFGITRYLLAISQSDLRVKISDDPYLTDIMTRWLSSFSTSQPWFEKIYLLGEDAKEAAKFALKKRVADVAVVYPYKISDVGSLLCQLTAKQISWKLIKEDEKTDVEIVLTPSSKELIGDENSTNVQMAVEKLSERLPNRPVVKEKNGDLAKDIFIRQYKDGSIVVVNFTEKKRELTLVRNGKEIPFTIYSEDVLALEKNEIPEEKYTKNIEIKEPQWKVSINRPNTMRPTFLNSPKFKFELESDMTLDIAIREYGDIPQLTLDGKPLKANNKCITLPEGFEPLYKQLTINLSKGKHVIKLENDARDFTFMPIAVICGNFSVNGTTLTKYSNDGKGLSGVVGKISQESDITIPQNAKAVHFDTDALTSELFIGGESLGVKMWGNFVWKIPSKFTGKNVKVSLVRYSSLGRVFGTFDYVKPPASGWVSNFYKDVTPKNDRPIPPFAKINFLEK